jgi:hypothetical protein
MTSFAATPTGQPLGVTHPFGPSSATQDPALAGAEAGLTQTQITAEGEAAAERLAAQGAAAEGAAYRSSAAIAGNNAQVAGSAGDVLLYQQRLEAMKTVGAGQAAVGASGAAASGSALDIMRSSLQQGELGGQLVQMQTALNIGGYQEQVAAANAEVAGADAQVAADNALADSYSAEAAQASSQLKSLTPGGNSLHNTLSASSGFGVRVAGSLKGFGGPTENF